MYLEIADQIPFTINISNFKSMRSSFKYINCMPKSIWSHCPPTISPHLFVKPTASRKAAKNQSRQASHVKLSRTNRYNKSRASREVALLICKNARCVSVRLSLFVFECFRSTKRNHTLHYIVQSSRIAAIPLTALRSAVSAFSIHSDPRLARRAKSSRSRFSSCRPRAGTSCLPYVVFFLWSAILSYVYRVLCVSVWVRISPKHT